MSEADIEVPRGSNGYRERISALFAGFVQSACLVSQLTACAGVTAQIPVRPDPTETALQPDGNKKASPKVVEDEARGPIGLTARDIYSDYSFCHYSGIDF